MTRSELNLGIEEIGSALRESGLGDVLSRMLEAGDGENLSKEILKALKDYAFMAQNYAPAARRVVDLIELHDLEDSDTWLLLMGDVEEAYLEDKRMRIHVIKDLLPLLADLAHKDPQIFSEISALLEEVEEDGDVPEEPVAGAEEGGEETAQDDMEAAEDEETPAEGEEDEMTRLFNKHIQSE